MKQKKGKNLGKNEQENILEAMKANNPTEDTYLAESFIWCMLSQYLNIYN